MATRIGLEPTTPSVTGWCSNQLSYRAMIAQVRGVLTAGTLTIIPEKSYNVKQKFEKTTNIFSAVKQNARSSQKSSRRYGRGSKFRTHGTRFWRPLLYQLSYTPKSLEVPPLAKPYGGPSGTRTQDRPVMSRLL